jgi:hypothetical protein
MRFGFPEFTSTKISFSPVWRWIRIVFSTFIRNSVIDRDQFEAFKRERNACIIGVDIANRYHLKIGGHHADGGRRLSRPVGVRGARHLLSRDQTTDPSSMMFHYRYVDERVRQESPTEQGRSAGISFALTIPPIPRRFPRTSIISS